MQILTEGRGHTGKNQVSFHSQGHKVKTIGKETTAKTFNSTVNFSLTSILSVHEYVT